MKKIVLLILALMGGGAAIAAPKEKPYLRLLDVKTETIEPTTPEGRPKTVQHFVIVWQNIDIPATFFWRGESGWVNCKMQKAHRSRRTKDLYTTEPMMLDSVHRGDTLMVTPTPGGKFRVPAEIWPTDKNKLYFKSGGSNWIGYPIKVPNRASPRPSPTERVK